jgi:hypothetical protein
VTGSAVVCRSLRLGIRLRDYDVHTGLMTEHDLQLAAALVLADVASTTSISVGPTSTSSNEDGLELTVVLDDTEICWTMPDSPLAETAVVLAEMIQYEVDMRIHEQWPPCPRSNPHSLTPVVINGVTMWCCEVHGPRVPVGSLAVA